MRRLPTLALLHSKTNPQSPLLHRAVPPASLRPHFPALSAGSTFLQAERLSPHRSSPASTAPSTQLGTRDSGSTRPSSIPAESIARRKRETRETATRSTKWFGPSGSSSSTFLRTSRRSDGCGLPPPCCRALRRLVTSSSQRRREAVRRCRPPARCQLSRRGRPCSAQKTRRLPNGRSKSSRRLDGTKLFLVGCLASSRRLRPQPTLRQRGRCSTWLLGAGPAP